MKTLGSSLVILSLTAGCTVPKKGGLDEVNKLLGDRGAAPIHWNQGTEEDEKAAERVRKLLGEELTVASAVQIALVNNPRMQGTYERLGVAQADLVQAGLLRNPSIGGHIGFPLGTSILELEASVSGEFLDLFLIPLKRRFAQAEFRRVKLEVADAVLGLAADVRRAFYTVQATLQSVALRRTILDAAQASAELAARQHQAGNLSDLDLASQQRLYIQARLDLARAEAQLLADREQLTRLLGAWGQGAEWRMAAMLPELPKTEPDLAHLESVAIAQRLDLAAAREEASTVAASLRITSATRVIGGLQIGGAVHQDADGPRTIGPSVSLELPIFDQKQAAVARLRAQLRAAERHVEALAIDIRSEVRAGRNRVQAARAVVDYYRATLMPLSERLVALSQQQYNAMLLGVYQLLQSRREEVDAYRDYIEAVREYWIARSDLERAAGGRLPEAPKPQVTLGETR